MAEKGGGRTGIPSAAVLAALLILLPSGAADASCNGGNRVDHENAECLSAWWKNRGVLRKSPYYVRNMCPEYGKVVAKVDLKSARDRTLHLHGGLPREGDTRHRIRGISCCSDAGTLCNRSDVVTGPGCLARFHQTSSAAWSCMNETAAAAISGGNYNCTIRAKCERMEQYGTPHYAESSITVPWYDLDDVRNCDGVLTRGPCGDDRAAGAAGSPSGAERRERLAGFGRAVASSLAEGLGDRLTGGVAETHATMAGRRIAPIAAPGDVAEAGGPQPGPQAVRGRDLLAGSAFLFAGGADRSGGRWSIWGQAAPMAFAGAEWTGGEGLLGLSGIDYGRGRLLAGVALSHGLAGGRLPPAGSRGIEASLSGVHPYARLSLSDRIALWGALGYATGEMKVVERGGRRTRMTMSMAAAGAEGALLGGEEADSPTVSLKSDAYLARLTSEAASPEVVVSGLRVALDGAHRFDFDRDRSLTPSLEAGLHREGGDGAAEAGVRLEAAMDYEAPGHGAALRFWNRAGAGEGWGASLSAEHDAGTQGRLSLAPYLHVIGGGPAGTEYRLGLWLRMPLGGGPTPPASGRSR